MRKVTAWVTAILLGASAGSARAQEAHRQILRDKLQTGLEAIAQGHEGAVGAHIVDRTDGTRFGVTDDLVFPQASAIKIPILLELAPGCRWMSSVGSRHTISSPEFSLAAPGQPGAPPV